MSESAVGCAVKFDGLGVGEVIHDSGELLLIRFVDGSGEPLHRIIPWHAFERVDPFREALRGMSRLADHVRAGGVPEDFEPESPDA